MGKTIVINQDNIVDSDNNILEYSFPNSVQFSNHEIAVAQVNMYYSWTNINSTPLINNTFQYQWTVGSTTTTFDVVLPDGLYEVADINAYLQAEFIENGHYLKNADGDNFFYAEFVVNKTNYGVTLNTYPVPTSLPSGFTAPTQDAQSTATTAAFVGFPTTTFNPNIKMVSSNNFHKLIGFSSTFESGLLSGGNQNKSFNSTTAPLISPNFNLYLALQNISNPYASPSTIIHSLSPQVGFGELIIDRPNEFSYNDLTKGTYNKLRLQILGSDKLPIKILDPEISIVLLIREKKQ